MLFSVIIPTYKRIELVCRCVEMLLPEHQQFDPSQYEVIIMDDNSNDALQQALAKKYPFAKVHKGPRRGPSANRNAGAKIAKGTWLVFIDDDCKPGEFLLAAYANQISKGGIKVLEGCTLVPRKKKKFSEEAPFNWSGGNLWSCNFAIEKDFFDDLGGFDENFLTPCLEDVDLRYRIDGREKIRFVPTAVVVHEWRQRKPFKNLSAQLRAHKYFYKKHSEHSARHIAKRVSKFCTESVILTGELVKYSFRGFDVYLEKMTLYFALIFC